MRAFWQCKCPNPGSSAPPSSLPSSAHMPAPEGRAQEAVFTEVGSDSSQLNWPQRSPTLNPHQSSYNSEQAQMAQHLWHTPCHHWGWRVPLRLGLHRLQLPCWPPPSHDWALPPALPLMLLCQWPQQPPPPSQEPPCLLWPSQLLPSLLLLSRRPPSLMRPSRQRLSWRLPSQREPSPLPLACACALPGGAALRPYMATWEVGEPAAACITQVGMELELLSAPPCGTLTEGLLAHMHQHFTLACRAWSNTRVRSLAGQTVCKCAGFGPCLSV